jgi:hypothetical protein
LPIGERDIDQPEIVDGVVEKGSFRDVKIIVGLIAGRSDKVKIPHDGNRTRKRCKDLGEGVEETGFLVMDARAIDVDNREREVVSAEREGGSYRELINGVMKQLQNLVVPSSNNATGGAKRRLEHKGSKRRREERGGEKRRDIRAFGFLNAKHSWEEGINSSMHVIPFASLPETTDIPAGKQ